MIYDVNGNALTNAYDVNGTDLDIAYDIDGTVVFRKQEEPLTLRVMTYNVGGWYTGTGDNVPAAKDADYYALQNGIISRQNADILCLEEFWTTFSKTGRSAVDMLAQYYPYRQLYQGNTQYWGHGVCSKYPIESYTRHYFTSENARYYDTAVVNVNGTRLNVTVTHLGLTVDIRVTQAKELFDFVQTQNNVILCGDFNINAKNPTYFADDYQQFVDAGYHLANGGTHGYFDTYQSSDGSYWVAIDQIITSSNIAIDSVWTDTTKVTDSLADAIDHIPLVAEVTIS